MYKLLICGLIVKFLVFVSKFRASFLSEFPLAMYAITVVFIGSVFDDLILVANMGGKYLHSH